MADDPNERGPADRARINVEQDYELRYWSRKFGVDAERLRAAVAKVGPMADKVAGELGRV
ncbi:hypothetical protein STVA_11480 [Allostella vacuolata]|nr:hypothetical protein STVA_11480 [Stella vacuolata]